MIVLYPGYNFESLATNRSETEAAELLALWQAAFHPALIEKFDVLPRWESASAATYNTAKHPVLVPPCCESDLNDDWLRQQETEGTLLIRNKTGRSEVQEELLHRTELTEHGFDPEYVANFKALATTYLLTELLVRQMHYMSMTDDSQSLTQLSHSLRAYRAGNFDGAHDHLRQAFDAVSGSKQYFYPIDSYLLDLTLLAETTLGKPLRKLLQDRSKINLFLPSRVLKELPQRDPESFALLREATQQGKVGFVFDDLEEKSLMLLPLLDLADSILGGLSLYRELLQVSPTVYGRIRGGLTPALPKILNLLDLKGVLHFAPMDGWRIKEEAQSKMIWQGIDGTKFDALTRYPIGASTARGFFEMANLLGETISNDHAPTVILAEFPGVLNPDSWLEDIRRMESFTKEYGSFSLIEKYFENTPQCGGVRKLGFDHYPGQGLVDPLTAAVQADDSRPISYWNEIYRANVHRTAESAFSTVRALLGLPHSDLPPGPLLAQTLTGANEKNATNEKVSDTPSENYHRILLTNPWTCPRRVYLDLSDWTRLPEEVAPVVLARQTLERKEIIVDVPPVGYVLLEEPSAEHDRTPAKEKGAEKTKQAGGPLKRLSSTLAGFLGRNAETEPELILATSDDAGKNVKRPVYLLRNEFFEAKIDAATGMLRSVFTGQSRFNRLSRQLGFRYPKEERSGDPRSANDPNRGYATMVAEDVSIESSGPISGRLCIRGSLVGPSGDRQATFEEKVTIRRCSRLLEFDLSLRPVSDSGDARPSLTGSHWDSYFAVRYAWNDNTMDLYGGLADGVHQWTSDRVLAPKFVNLRAEKSSLTFFTEGLPFHRRFGERRLETILIAGNESERNFRLGIGVDTSYPAAASMEFLADKGVLTASVTGSISCPSAWLFQVEAKSVVALHWEPLFGEEGENDPAKPIGYRVFLLETEGHRVRFAFHSFLRPTQAWSTNFLGVKSKQLKTEDNRVLIDMHGHELLPLCVYIRD